MIRRLLLGVLAETADGGTHGDRGGGVEGVRPARLGLLAAGALPDADSLALHGVLAAEVAEKFGVLGHLLLLHHLAEGSAVTGAVLADDPWWVKGREWDDAVSVCVCMGSMDERAKSLGRIQPPVRSWLGGYISPRMARGMSAG